MREEGGCESRLVDGIRGKGKVDGCGWLLDRLVLVHRMGMGKIEVVRLCIFLAFGFIIIR